MTESNVSQQNSQSVNLKEFDEDEMRIKPILFYLTIVMMSLLDLPGSAINLQELKHFLFDDDDEVLLDSPGSISNDWTGHTKNNSECLGSELTKRVITRIKPQLC
jgi:hypothetical protein